RRPHVERGRGGFERKAAEHQRETEHEQGVVGVRRGPDPVEAELAGGAVDERGAEEERRRADRADDQVLQPGLERADEVDVDRAEDVEGDREPLEPEEERHQVRGLDEERHAAAGGEERVVLGDVLLAPALAVGEEDRDASAGGDERLRERGPAVAEDRVGDRRGGMRAPRRERDRERERGDEARARARGRERLASVPGREHGHEQEQAGDAGQDERRGEREPVDVRATDHRNPWQSGVRQVEPSGARVSAWPEIAAGQAESASRQATSGTTIASSAPRRSSAAGVTAGPGSTCSTAEISRSMYRAASTIAAAPTTAQPQPWRKTPARIRNSPAKLEESGTASAITPVVISTVASAGRPRAIPPSSASSPVAARRST